MRACKIAAVTPQQQKLEEFDRELQPSELTAAVDDSLRQRGRRFLGILGQFVLGQGATQTVNVLANLFLVHRLSVEAYAQFGLTQGFQNTFSVLMDLGFASTIVPLVADRREDKVLVGRYVRSANHLRNRSFSVLAPLAALLFLTIMHRHHWGAMVQVLLLASVLLSLYAGGMQASFSAPLFIFRRLKDYYLPQAVFGVVRLAIYIVLAFTAGLGAWTAAVVNALYITATAGFIRRKSQRYLDWPQQESRETDREILRYILPASPAIVFSAFQTQISLFLVSIFGGTLFIAEVAALSRIGQVFALLLTMCSILVEPYMARLSRERVLRFYLLFMAATAMLCVPLVGTAFRWPGVYLWLIGAKYEGVRPLLGWYFLSLSMNLVSGVVWVMNRARKWVFWSGSMIEIVLVLGVQIGFLLLVGVRDTREAVFFNLAASFGYAIAHGYVGILGFLRGPRQQAAEEVRGS
jgi:O-antigen/teichoic acid export membrane protein